MQKYAPFNFSYNPENDVDDSKQKYQMKSKKETLVVNGKDTLTYIKRTNSTNAKFSKKHYAKKS